MQRMESENSWAAIPPPPFHLRTVGQRVHRVSVVVPGIGLVDPAPGARGARGHAGRSRRDGSGGGGGSGRGCLPLLLWLLQGRPLLLLLLLGGGKHRLLLLPVRERCGIYRLRHRHVLLLRTGRRGSGSGGDDGRLLRTCRRGIPQCGSGCE